ncbi:unnamed protein product [Dovyalis caffra]|uniref:Protein NIM1-INTERACTING 1 n=1 Tax=Dovyalis caffra TaxID=77055 RepID=A0AAV1SAJ4_9ROSI|nr:unnamed protein product [Dovyalis caffra]
MHDVRLITSANQPNSCLDILDARTNSPTLAGWGIFVFSIFNQLRFSGAGVLLSDMENEKVKGSVDNIGELDEQEDQKMEQFFALIRSFQDARNRRKDEMEEKQQKKKARGPNDQEQQSSWVPSFEWEDFTKDIQFRNPPLIFPGPCNNEKKLEDKKPKEDDGLDLGLTL